ncbi:pyridoxamine 5'-phosphate oxidase family protein [Microbacterium sp. Leaf288]|uniref:pyridoxamine 5'-phosphate oxidase family protein n=1 Tax=Microbacterium sp. Leaf288 TaxID=1736323 RepID=UPI001910B096|nr:pyridoxamine 5'-phosphate oxidase family protein [Microbacterium sp. Leaf288]
MIRDEPQLRRLFHDVTSLAEEKVLGELDVHARAFIERSPFVCIGTQDAAGNADVSPRGDPPGFVCVLDAHTLAIPDRPGNNRLDSLTNILSNPAVGLLFIIPGSDDTLRVNGHARITTAPDLLEPMAIKGRSPKLALVVDVTEVFLHCAKAFKRSRLWDPAEQIHKGELPSLSKMIRDQTGAAPTSEAEMQRIDEDLEREYDRTMY